MQHRRRFAAAILAFSAMFGGYSPAAKAAENVVVFAAASLKNALGEISAGWEQETGKRATISYAASSALAKQIENAAPADIFISADLDWMKYLSEKKITKAGTEIELLGNSIVLVAPEDSTAKATIKKGFPLAELIGDGKLAMANVKAVPAGKYGKAALEALGVWASVEGKVAQAENVRSALKLVSTGEAKLGIVYQTDAVAEPGVRILGAFPANTHAPIIYPAALTASSSKADAVAFLKYLQSRKAVEIFERQGFKVLALVN